MFLHDLCVLSKCFLQILQMKETTNPFSLAVFNDMLYWTDAKRRVVQAAHKISGKQHQVLLKRPKQPFGVKVSEMHGLKDVEAQLETKLLSYNGH